MDGGTGKKGVPKSTQQSSAPKPVLKPEPNTQIKLPSAPKIGSKIAWKPVPKTASKPVPKTKAKTAPKTQAELTPTPKTETKLSSPLKIARKTEAKLASPLKSAPKSPLKTAPKTETKLTSPLKTASAFPGQPLDKNIKIDIKTRLTRTYSHKASDDTAIVSTALPVEDTALRFGMSSKATSKAPSAFEKGDRGYQSAGFRKKNKEAGPDFVGFHLGERATPPGEGPNWLEKTTTSVANFFKSQNRNLGPAQTSSVCKLTKNVVEEVRAAQRGQTSGPQKSVTTNVPISHGFPGTSFVTNDQGTAGKWSEQLPNAFPQQEAKENMDRNTDLLCQPPSRREEQSPTNKPVDEGEPDPWPKKRTADVAEAGQVDEAQSPGKMSKGLSKASDDELMMTGDKIKRTSGCCRSKAIHSAST